VHERHLRSQRFDGRAIACDIGERLATERSPEVAQEDQQDGALLLPLAQVGWQRLEPCRGHGPTLGFQRSAVSDQPSAEQRDGIRPLIAEGRHLPITPP
jgi:hypothetical protein